MKAFTLLILCASLSSFAAPDDSLLLRIKLGESIFDERFAATRIERMFAANLDGELTLLEKGPAQAEVLKIRKVFADVARDVSSSQSFREQYAEWIATQLSERELREYLEFLRTPLGKKVAELDDRVQPLLTEAIQLRDKGRLETIPLFLAEARNK